MAKKALSWSDLRLIEQLGHGQAGSVWRAELLQAVGDLPRGASVAVKLYKAWVMEQEGQMERIIREVEIGRSLNHPHIVRTLTLTVEPSGRPALVMVYYRGKTLQCVLEGQRTSESPMSPEEALHILGPLADALATLHSRGVVHRDVKPANIMITEDGPILMDFGVVQTDRFPEQTTSGQFLGTIRYGAPEYLFGEASTMLADVFAFGAIAYELFFGDVFLGGEQHWARQIARKASWPQGPSSEDYQALAARVGLRYAELAKFICDRALAPAKRRDLNLAAFAAAIASGAVRQPFTVDDGRLQPGTGRWPRIAGMECTATDCAPEDIALHIQRVLSGSELEYLLGLLEGSYWKGYVVADVSDRRLLRLETLDILERGDIGGFTAHFFRPGVTAAYRYGLLRPHRR